MIEELAGLYRRLLVELGEDPEREGLRKTPERAASAILDLTRGYGQDLGAVLNGAIFHEEYDDMIIVRDIEFYSLCEHHLLPFFGCAHVGYIPNGQIVGLSKIARIVDLYSRRLQVQERMTHEIAHSLEDAIHPRGVAVVIEARHLCVMARGIEKQASKMLTSAVLGDFREDRRTRDEFIELLRRGS
jgi:GTP cyclohydrolase I